MRAIFAMFAAAALLSAQNAVIREAPPVRAANGAVVQQSRPAAFDCSAEGTVVNAVTGEPIPRAHVAVIVAGTSSSTSTDGSGHWTLSNLGCAPGQLQVTRAGFLQGAAFLTGVGTPLIRPLQLISGSPVHDLRTEMVPQSVAMGKVIDDQGDPVMGVQVMALTAVVTDGRPRFQQVGTNMTNDIGEYRIANLPRGSYIFCTQMNLRPIDNAERTTSDAGCYPGPLEGGAASAMSLAPGREVKVDFTMRQVSTVHVRGTITGIPEGRGIGVSLVKREPNSDVSRSIGGNVRDGQFDFRALPGSYTLVADYFEAGKRQSSRVPVEVGSTDVDNVVVRMEPGFTVTGLVRVHSQSSAPAPQFNVNLRPTEPNAGGGQAKWSTDRTSFTFTDMVPGAFRLTGQPPAPFYIKSATLAGQDILDHEIPISQAAGPIEITLRDDGGSLDADVVDAAGQPVAATVMLLRGTNRVASFPAGSNGHFKLANIAPGDYVVYAWDNPNQVQYAEPDWMRRYGSGGVSVTISAGQNAQVKLTQQSVPVP
jgi:hypothetical protein